MGWNRIGSTLVKGIWFYEISVLDTQDCNVKYISYWLKKKKKNWRSSVCLGLLKQIPGLRKDFLDPYLRNFALRTRSLGDISIL